MMQTTRNCDLTNKRDYEISCICKKLIAQQLAQGKKARMKEISVLAAKCPSSRFWISEERAQIVIYSWYSHDVYGKPYPPYADPSRMFSLHVQMFQEVYSRCKILRQRHPSRPMTSIIASVVNSPAPSFYLTPKTILVYYYAQRKKNASKRNATYNQQ